MVDGDGWEGEQREITSIHAAAPALAFALVMVTLNCTFGIYRRRESLSSAAYVLRLCLAPAIGVPLAYFIADALPGGGLFQQYVGVVFISAFAGLLLHHPLQH